jgi:ABC-2 type transport system ATP-binding protein
MTDKFALEIKNLKKTYKEGVVAVNDLSFSVAKGDFFALLGHNGAGKSTTIGMIVDLVRKDSGSITIFGNSVEDSGATVKASIGLVTQEFNFPFFEKVDDILITNAGYFGIPRIEAKRRAAHLLKQLGMLDKSRTPARTLSGGMKRKLMIARALMHKPKLLILDEPTAGVDVETRDDLWKFVVDLNKKGTTIILTTHYLEEAENLCKNIAIINKGKIVVNDSMKNLLSGMDKKTLLVECKESFKIKASSPLHITKVDTYTARVVLSKNQSINDVVAAFPDNTITNIKNEKTRLEEIFFELKEKGDTNE